MLNIHSPPTSKVLIKSTAIAKVKVIKLSTSVAIIKGLPASYIKTPFLKGRPSSNIHKNYGYTNKYLRI